MRSGAPRQAAEAGVRAAVRALATGRMVVVADDREREDEGDLVAAAALMSAEQMAFFLRHGSGIVCVPMSDERANELELPLMVDQNTESHGTAFTISVDHRSVTSLNGDWHYLVDQPPARGLYTLEGKVRPGVSAKDIALAIVSSLGTPTASRHTMRLLATSTASNVISSCLPAIR